jgi:hypothetical protein
MTQSQGKTDDRPSPTEELRRLYDEMENRTAKAFDELVSRPSFGEVLARVTENVVAITRISNDSLDMVLRNLRIAGRQDLVRVGRQLARTEDKLEMVLQEVERLREDVGKVGKAAQTDSPARSRKDAGGDTSPTSSAGQRQGAKS